MLLCLGVWLGYQGGKDVLDPCLGRLLGGLAGLGAWGSRCLARCCCCCCGGGEGEEGRRGGGVGGAGGAGERARRRQAAGRPGVAGSAAGAAGVAGGSSAGAGAGRGGLSAERYAAAMRAVDGVLRGAGVLRPAQPYAPVSTQEDV